MPANKNEWANNLDNYICDNFGACVMTDEGVTHPELRLAGWLIDSLTGFDPMPVRAGDSIRFPVREGSGFDGMDFYPIHYAFPSEDDARAAMAHVELAFSLAR